jgi:hypothetical protein
MQRLSWNMILAAASVLWFAGSLHVLMQMRDELRDIRATTGLMQGEVGATQLSTLQVHLDLLHLQHTLDLIHLQHALDLSVPVLVLDLRPPLATGVQP